MSPSPSLLRRLQKEQTSLLSLPPSESISAAPSPTNPLSWTATLPGPPHSPYASGTFHLSIQYPETYPASPPSIKFLTKIYHPDIDPRTGFIGLNILHEDWCPALTVEKILLSLQALLTDPDPEVAVCEEIAIEVLMRRGEFERRAGEWTEKYARGEGIDGEKGKGVGFVE